MTVAELIARLQLISDKSLPVVYDLEWAWQSISEVEVGKDYLDGPQVVLS